MAILMTGGAGYIGSHCYYEFIEAGEELIILDNLSTGDRRTLPENTKLYIGNVGDKDILNSIFSKHSIETIIHFAGSLVVEESVYNPGLYYKNNVINSLNLIETALEHNIKKLIFSSTASVYGNNPKQVMEETDPVSPENPYAESKLVVENMIRNFSRSHGLDFIILRYFNVAGADKALRTGQYSKNATHLLKIACEVAIGKRSLISIFGNDYDTPDGTCVRDYIHVSDLARAHYQCYSYLIKNDKCQEIFNCGYGKGFSVKEVIDEFNKLPGVELEAVSAPRRAGDPAALIANSSKLKKLTHWEPKYDQFQTIIESALNWERRI